MSVTMTLNDLITKLQTAIRDKDLGAAEAIGAEIKALNDQVALTARKVVYICNITQEGFNLTRTFGYVNIAGAKKGQRYGLTPVREYHDRIVYDDKHQIPVTFPAAEVAEDIVRSCNADAGDDEFPNSFLGVFLCAGDTPMEDELRDAENRLRDFDTHLVRKADEKWSATHNYREITGAERRAAGRIRVKREWLFQPEANVTCPFCQQPMPKDAVIHAGPGGCGQIVDRVRYAAMTAPPPPTSTELSDEELDTLTDPNKTK
jgi:hypothetical protein